MRTNSRLFLPTCAELASNRAFCSFYLNVRPLRTCQIMKITCKKMSLSPLFWVLKVREINPERCESNSDLDEIHYARSHGLWNIQHMTLYLPFVVLPFHVFSGILSVFSFAVTAWPSFFLPFFFPSISLTYQNNLGFSVKVQRTYYKENFKILCKTKMALSPVN